MEEHGAARYASGYRPAKQEAAMTIALTDRQAAWLSESVAAGRFASVDEGVRTILDAHIDFEADGFEWAKPLLDAARAEIARGEVVPYAEVREELTERIRRLSAP
jgi:Arc/MetJ-type ribon-helix-helix transcriptional regulator